MRWKPTAVVFLVPLFSVVFASFDTTTSDLQVYTGYADNLNTVGARSTPAQFPNPWRGSGNVTFVGSGDRFDSGAVRVENKSGDQMTVEKVTVDVGPKHYDLWGSNLRVPANGSLVLTQTVLGSLNPPQPNFDSSEPNGTAPAASGNGATAQGSNVVPVIHVTVNGHTADYRDTGKVLNTGGLDKGDLPGAPNESHGWQLLSAVAGSSQGGVSPVLLFAPLAAMLLAFLSWIPKLIGALILLLIGWLIAGALARLVIGLVGRTGLAAAADRTGLFAFAAATRRRRPGGFAWVFAEIVKWFVFLIFVSLAAEAIGLAEISVLLHRIIFWIPNLLVALLVVVLGILLARFLAGLTRATVATARVGNPNVLARIVEFVVIGLAAVVALTQIGVAAVIIDILLVGLMLAVALAFGLSFGLGGRTVTSQIWRSVTPSSGTLARVTEMTESPADATPTTSTTTTRRRS